MTDTVLWSRLHAFISETKMYKGSIGSKERREYVMGWLSRQKVTCDFWKTNCSVSFGGDNKNHTALKRGKKPLSLIPTLLELTLLPLEIYKIQQRL